MDKFDEQTCSLVRKQCHKAACIIAHSGVNVESVIFLTKANPIRGVKCRNIRAELSTGVDKLLIEMIECLNCATDVKRVPFGENK